MICDRGTPQKDLIEALKTITSLTTENARLVLENEKLKRSAADENEATPPAREAGAAHKRAKTGDDGHDDGRQASSLAPVPSYNTHIGGNHTDNKNTAKPEQTKYVLPTASFAACN